MDRQLKVPPDVLATRCTPTLSSAAGTSVSFMAVLLTSVGRVLCDILLRILRVLGSFVDLVMPCSVVIRFRLLVALHLIMCSCMLGKCSIVLSMACGRWLGATSLRQQRISELACCVVGGDILS